MGTRRVSALAVVATGLLTARLLAACGAKSSPGGTAAPASASGPPSVSVTPSGSSPGVAPSTTPPPPGHSPATAPSLPIRSLAPQGSETLVGDLEDGVEPNCVLLRTSSNKLYQLVGGDRSKLTGSSKHVTVDGHEIPAMATTCQQGIPFLVTSIRPS